MCIQLFRSTFLIIFFISGYVIFTEKKGGHAAGLIGYVISVTHVIYLGSGVLGGGRRGPGLGEGSILAVWQASHKQAV